MRRKILFLAILAAAFRAGASWYWPFGDDEPKEPRVSTLMEPASLLIDKASDLASEGKVQEAVEAYGQALKELDRIEIENPERVDKPEFATVRNKRVYIEAAIDALYFEQVNRNASTIAVSNTKDLERRLKKEREDEKAVAARARAASAATSSSRTTATDAEAASRRERMKDAKESLDAGDFEMARELLGGLLKERPNDAPALNMMAMVEMAEGDDAAAEATLRRLIKSNPSLYYGYYNLARLILRTQGEDGVDAARSYYRTARDNCNGPADPDLEERLK